MESFSTIPVLNIKMYADRLSHAADLVLEGCCNDTTKGNLRISATGAHGLVTAQKKSEFKETLNSCFLNLPDGMPAVWVGRLKGARTMERCYGPDFFTEVIKRSASHTINHFFCGGKPGVAEELKFICQPLLQNSRVVGTFSPPFNGMTDFELNELGTYITAANTHILWIGLSTPKQELFARRLAPYVKVHFIITIGAAFDFFTGHVKQAPRFIQRAGIEWLFRLCIEPRRLFKRYFEIVPQFILYTIIDFFTLYRHRQKNVHGI
jgi:N-acetylglucosaminyldiphosphoundecaprenol N-acetyl-beta-D-mannosaminyltransferase